MFTTFKGKHINLLALTASDIDIEDIAHQLALINRFNGATRRPMSVAQHSVYVKRLVETVPVEGGPMYPAIAMQALLHDASEAYLGDVTKWLKQTDLFAGYRDLEEFVQGLIWRKYGCQVTQPAVIDWADRLMVRYEAHKLRGPIVDPHTLQPHPKYPPPTQEEIALVGKWAPWSWKTAREVFLVEFNMAQSRMAA